MASGDVVFEQTDMAVSGIALGNKDVGNSYGGGTTELLTNLAKVNVQPYWSLGVFFDRNKTYDVVIKEH